MRRADTALDSGHLALLGHRILGAVSVVAGACETLACDTNRIAAVDRGVLEEVIQRNLADVADCARALVHGEVSPISP